MPEIHRRAEWELPMGTVKSWRPVFETWGRCAGKRATDQRAADRFCRGRGGSKSSASKRVVSPPRASVSNPKRIPPTDLALRCARAREEDRAKSAHNCNTVAS